MSLLSDLLNAGIGQQDARTLDAAFAMEPEFFDGMEQVARILALKEPPGTAPPAGEPWKSIFYSMVNDLQAGADHDTAWRQAIGGLDPSMQFALTTVAQVGMKNILDLEQQKQKRKLKTVHYLKEFKALGYTFKMNMCDDSIEVESGGQAERMNDGLSMVIYRQMSDKGFGGREEVESCLIAAAYQARYHPVRQYLTGLTYDGGHYIEELASYFQDEKNAFSLWLRKWLIGAVAKAFTGAQNPMLVMDGDQNIGKSSFCRWLASGLPRYFIESSVDPENKDTMITLINKWIWEVGELGATTRKADREALKSFLTLQEVTVRVPYGHYAIQKPAMASFIGTVNNTSGILNDPTGSRRFHIAKMTKINWEYSKLNVNKIWGEAVAAYLTGEAWTLSDTERAFRDSINEEYQVEDPIENLLRNLFYLDADNRNWWTSTTEIIKTLEDPYQGAYRGGGTRSTTMQLAETMKRLGHVKGKRNNVNGYFGVTKAP
jgi:hypothetical protein